MCDRKKEGKKTHIYSKNVKEYMEELAMVAFKSADVTLGNDLQVARDRSLVVVFILSSRCIFFFSFDLFCT